MCETFDQDCIDEVLPQNEESSSGTSDQLVDPQQKPLTVISGRATSTNWSKLLLRQHNYLVWDNMV